MPGPVLVSEDMGMSKRDPALPTWGFPSRAVQA